jgi:hypothetical protein
MNTTDLFSRIKNGMPVYDVDGNQVGIVKYVQFGEEDFTEPSLATLTGSQLPDKSSGFANGVADTLVSRNAIPETLEKQMSRYGYIQIDTMGLLASDQYALGDTIASVNNRGVILNAGSNELVSL